MNKKVYPEHSLQIAQRLHGSHFFIVASFYEAPSNWGASLRFLESELRSALKERGAAVVHERWFGSEDFLLGEVKPVFLPIADDPSGLHACVTPMDGKPCYGRGEQACKGFSGIQIEAVIAGAQASAPEFIRDEHHSVVGRKWQEGKARFLILQNLCDLVPSHSNTEQTTQTLLRAEALLKKEGLDYHSVARTWIYLDDILAWYTPFNEARSAFYRQVGIMPDIERTTTTPPQECYLPASTGIRGHNVNGAACTIDLVAAQIPTDSGFTVRRLTNRKQKDAFRYGAAFARASVSETDQYSEVQISGTASIDEKGVSTHGGDSEAQIRNTLGIIETLIGEAHFKLTDICSATAFLKHEQDLPILLKLLNERGLSDLPVVICKADVCRDELLFELDGIAARSL